MAPRKDKPTPPKKDQKLLRFTLDDIERAILGVERAGLVVRSVEITASEAKGSTAPQDEVVPAKAKKQV